MSYSVVGELSLQKRNRTYNMERGWRCWWWIRSCSEISENRYESHAHAANNSNSNSKTLYLRYARTELNVRIAAKEDNTDTDKYILFRVIKYLYWTLCTSARTPPHIWLCRPICFVRSICGVRYFFQSFCLCPWVCVCVCVRESTACAAPKINWKNFKNHIYYYSRVNELDQGKMCARSFFFFFFSFSRVADCVCVCEWVCDAWLYAYISSKSNCWCWKADIKCINQRNGEGERARDKP